MYSRSIIFAFCIFIVCCSASFGETIYLNEGPFPVAERVIPQERNHLSLHFQINRIGIEEVTNKAGTFARIILDDSGYTRTIGKPMLPVIRRFVEIPMGADLEINAQGEPQPLYLSDYSSASLVMPVQPPQPKCECLSPDIGFAIDEAQYLTRANQFKVPVEVVDTGIIRGRRFAVIEVRLIDYNPVEGVFSAYPEMTVDVFFHHPDWDATERALVRYADVRSDSIAKRLFVNSLVEEGKTEIEYTAPASYLVIGGSPFIASDAFAAWVEWKRMKGYMVEVVDVTEIGATSANIRNFVQEAYRTWDYPPSFLLLVGDTNIIPHFIGEGTANPATDLYYSTVDGNDIFADLGVGRFSVTNEFELTHIVDKTLQYEKALWAEDDSWLDTATFLASQDRFSVTEGTHNWVCETIFEPAGINCEKLYSRQGTTKEQVLAAVNQGRVMVTFSGHGDVTAWVDGPYIENQDILGLTNEVYPFVSSFACLTGKYEQDRCFSEAWTRVAHGAVAMWASSVSSFWDEDDILEKGQMWGLFKGNEVPEGKAEYVEIPWFSGFTDFGKYVLYLWASMSGDTVRYFEMYNIMGDPETMAWTAWPEQPSVTHSEEYALGTDAIEVRVDGDFVFALVSISSEGTLMGSKLVSPGVKTAIPFFAPVEDSLSAVLTVTGHNLEPYIATIQFSGDASDDDTPDDGDDDEGDDDSVDDDDDDKYDDNQEIVGEEESDRGGCGC